MERPALVYGLISIAIVFLVLVRALLEKSSGWRRFFGFLGSLEVLVVSLLLASLIFFGCLQIFLRNFFHSGIVWADPLMRHVVLWLGCFGGMMATSRMRHINIDILTRVLPKKLQPVRDKVIYFATAVASSILGMAALKLVVDEKSFGEIAFLNVSVWVMQLILPIAFFLITYRSLLNILLAPEVKDVEWEEF